MKIKTYTIDRNTFMPEHNMGWGNGYVVLPEEHPLHGLGYYDIPESHEVDVHGGITYAETAANCSDEVKERLGLDGSEWVFGFDTAHGSDTPQRWTRETVQVELERFAKQFESMDQPLTEADLFETVKEKLEDAGASQELISRLYLALNP